MVSLHFCSRRYFFSGESTVSPTFARLHLVEKMKKHRHPSFGTFSFALQYSIETS